jgi:hypothetical protein
VPARAALALCALAAVLLAAAPAGATPSLGSWTATGHGLGAQTGVSCPEFGLCVSVAATSANVSTSPSAGPWSPQATGVTGGTLQAVSCAPGSAFCVAVGSGGAVAVNTNTGPGSWSASTQDGGNSLTSVSCPTTSFCIAVDSGGGAIYTTNSGASWTSETPGHTFTAVACASASFCAAIEQSTNQLYVSSSPQSGGWTHVTTVTGALTALACAGGQTCVAVDSSGVAWATANGSTWSSTPVASALSAVTCTPSGLCVATGGTTAYASDDPTASGPTWASSSIPAAPTGGVSCADQGLCAAVDGAGDAYVSTLPAPSASTGSASAVTQVAATLSATVNPNDAALTNCYFEYGPSTSYGSSIPCSSTPSATGGSQAVSAQVSGLAAGTTYHFQLVASNLVGSGAGGDQTFTTTAPVGPSPSIRGVPGVGDTLTCLIGVTLPAGTTASYSWVRDTTPIAGATGATYIVALADQTHHLYCTVTISGDGGNATANSGYLSVPSETLGTVFETIVGAPAPHPRSVSVPITCSPQAVKACFMTLTLTTLGRHPHRLGYKQVKIAPGAKATVTVALNASGRAALARHHRLKTKLTVSGTIIGVIKGTLKQQTITLTTGRHAARR